MKNKKHYLKRILLPLSLSSAITPMFLIGLSAKFNDSPTLPSETHLTPKDKANKTYDWEKQYTDLANWENKVELNAELKEQINKFYTSKLYNDLYKPVLHSDFDVFIETDYKDIIDHIITKHKQLLGDKNLIFYESFDKWKERTNTIGYIQLKSNIIKTLEAIVLAKYTTTKPTTEATYDLDDYLNNTNYTTMLNNFKTFYSQEKEFIKEYYTTFLEYYANIVDGSNRKGFYSHIDTLINFNNPAVLWETDDINNQITKTKEILEKQQEEFKKLNAEYKTKVETIDKQNWVREQLVRYSPDLSNFYISHTGDLKIYNKKDDAIFKPYSKNAQNPLQIGLGDINVSYNYSSNNDYSHTMTNQFIDYLEKIINNVSLNLNNAYTWDVKNNIMDVLILNRYIKLPNLIHNNQKLNSYVDNVINSIQIANGFVELFTRNNSNFLYLYNNSTNNPTIPKNQDLEGVIDYIDNLKTFLNQVGMEALDNINGLNNNSWFRNTLQGDANFYYIYGSVFNKNKSSTTSPDRYETYEYQTDPSKKDFYSSVVDWYKEINTYYKEHFLDTNTASVDNFKKYLKLLDVINYIANNSTYISSPISGVSSLSIKSADNLYFYKIHLDSLKEILNTNGGYEKYYSDERIDIEEQTILLSDYLSNKKTISLDIFNKGIYYGYTNTNTNTRTYDWPTEYPNHSKFSSISYQGGLFDTQVLSKYNGFISKGEFDKLEETEKEKYKTNTLAKDEMYWWVLEKVWDNIKDFIQNTKTVEQYNIKSKWYESVDKLYSDKESSKKWVEFILSLRNEFVYENLTDELNRQLFSTSMYQELKKVKILETDINISQYYDRLMETKNNLNLEYQNLNNNVPKLIKALELAQSVAGSDKYTQADTNKQQMFDLFFNTYKTQITDNKLSANITNSQLLQELDTIDFIIKMLGAESTIETTSNIQLDDLRNALTSLTDSLKTKIENEITIPETDENWNYDDLKTKKDILMSDLTSIKESVQSDDYSGLIAKINLLNTKTNELKDLENTLVIENTAKDLVIATTNDELKQTLKTANDNHKHNLDLINIYISELSKEVVDNSEELNEKSEKIQELEAKLQQHKDILNSLLNDKYNHLKQTHLWLKEQIQTLKDVNVVVDDLERFANETNSSLENIKTIMFNDDETLKDDLDVINVNNLMNLLESNLTPTNALVDLLMEVLEEFEPNDLTIQEFNKELNNSNEKLLNKKYQKALIKTLTKKLNTENEDTITREEHKNTLNRLFDDIFDDRLTIFKQKHSQLVGYIQTLKDSGVNVDDLIAVANQINTKLEEIKTNTFNEDETLKDDIDLTAINNKLIELDDKLQPLTAITLTLKETLDKFKESNLTLQEFNKELLNSNTPLPLFDKKYQKALIKALSKELKTNNVDVNVQKPKVNKNNTVLVLIFISLLCVLIGSTTLLTISSYKKL